MIFDLHRLALGTELLYQRGGGMQNALLSLGESYRGKSWEAAARLGLHAWHVSFLEKATKDVALVAELDGNLVQVCVQCSKEHFVSNLVFTEQPTVHRSG